MDHLSRFKPAKLQEGSKWKISPTNRGRHQRQLGHGTLKDLASRPLVLEDVAHAQTRLHRRNGKRPEEDGSES
jgi:hypothetical protein